MGGHRTPPRTRVLLIDDNPNLRRAFARLTHNLFDVTETHDCVSAAAAAAAAGAAGAPFDAVVTDLEMPECDGLEALQKIARVDARLARRAVMWTSAPPQDPRVLEAKTKGAWVLPKDATRAEIEIAVRGQIVAHP